MKRADPKPKSRIAKLLAVMNLLRDRKAPVTAAELAAILGASERTIYRYMAELIAQGMPVHGEPGFGYVLRPGIFLPPMTLTDDEAEAVLLGLKLAGLRTQGAFAETIQGTRLKIEDVLSTAPKEVFRHPAIILDESPTEGAEAIDFAPYLQAIRSQWRLAVEVHTPVAFSGLVCPVAVLVSYHRSSLLAWAEAEQSFVTLALSDMAAVITAERFPHSRRRLLEMWQSRRRLEALAH